MLAPDEYEGDDGQLPAAAGSDSGRRSPSDSIRNARDAGRNRDHARLFTADATADSRGAARPTAAFFATAERTADDASAARMPEPGADRSARTPKAVDAARGAPARSATAASTPGAPQQQQGEEKAAERSGVPRVLGAPCDGPGGDNDHDGAGDGHRGARLDGLAATAAGARAPSAPPLGGLCRDRSNSPRSSIVPPSPEPPPCLHRHD
jgi:hypothetical protein